MTTAYLFFPLLFSSARSFSFTLGSESLQPYPSPHPYQFPDAAITVLPSLPPSTSRLMFWSDGATYRVEGAGFFPSNTPSPLTPVLGNGPMNSLT